MGLRVSLVVPVLALAGLASCPRVDEAAPAPLEIAAPVPPPAASAPAPLARPVAAVATTAPSAAPASTATPEASVDPAALSTLPPDLVDDGSDDLHDDTPAAPPEPEKELLASIARETWIYAEPRWSSRRLGYLRAGAVVARRDEPSGFAGCDGGWYRIEPHGYVCVGPFATLDVYHPVVEISSRRPRRDGLPYTYVMSRFPTPPLYARLPTPAQELEAEPDLRGHLRKLGLLRRDPSFVEPPPLDPLPSALLYDQPAPALANEPRPRDAVVLGRARTHSGFALLSTFDHEGRAFGLTTELALVPLDRVRVIRPSTFAGLKLDGDTTLPVAFVMKHHAARFHASGEAAMARGEPLGFRESVPLTGRELHARGGSYLEAKDGSWVRADDVVRVDAFRKAPAWANRKWIDVSILHQSLVAYEGTKPVFVTLVSTGADGLGDPKKTHSTIRGAFLIHTKHVSVTMDGDDVGDEFDLRDVPFVQYFTEGFALHGAYWHDDFGHARSHGCVNLSPKDAAWLFGWTDPEVPETWHAALSLKRGTLVYIHP